MENFLLEGEQLLNQSSNGVVILTTHRIRFNDANASASHTVSIMLEKVSSCETRYQSWPVVLIVGILMLLFGAFAVAKGESTAVPAFIVGALFVVIYLSTRKHIISISSDGGAKIGFETKGLKREAVLEFINGIERAKNQRVFNLHRVGASVFA